MHLFRSLTSGQARHACDVCQRSYRHSHLKCSSLQALTSPHLRSIPPDRSILNNIPASHPSIPPSPPPKPSSKLTIIHIKTSSKTLYHHLKFSSLFHLSLSRPPSHPSHRPSYPPSWHFWHSSLHLTSRDVQRALRACVRFGRLGRRRVSA